MSAPLPFVGRPTPAERDADQRLLRLDARREDELVRLHQRLDALLFWVVLVLCGLAFGVFAWVPAGMPA